MPLALAKASTKVQILTDTSTKVVQILTGGAERAADAAAAAKAQVAYADVC